MKKEHLAWFVLWSLFVFHLINNMAIIFRDTTPFAGGASAYYQSSFRYWKTWTGFVKSGDPTLLRLILLGGLAGQLPALLAIPFFSVFGVSHDTAILANQTFFLVLIFSMYGLGKILFDRKMGLMAAFLISFYLGVVGFSRVYMLEFPILAISTLCVYLLVKSGGFKNFKYSLCFGFAIALGELLRPRFVVYIIFPILFYVIKHIVVLLRRTEVPAQISVTKIAINVFSSAVLSCFLLFPWFSIDRIFGYLRDQKLWSSWPAFSNISATLPYYFQILMGEYLGLFFTFLFLLGLVVSLFERSKRPKIYFLLVWFMLTLILLSMFGLKVYSRLAVPLLVPLALISSAGMAGLFKLKIGKYLGVAFLIFGVFQYFFISYDHKSVDEEDAVRHVGSVFSKGLLQARSYDWNPDELILLLKEHRNSDEAWSWSLITKNHRYLIKKPGFLQKKKVGHLIKVLDVDFQGSIIYNEMAEKILTDDLPIAVMGLFPDGFSWKMLFSDKDFQHMVLGADYVIRHKVKRSESGFIDKILSIFDAHGAQFEELKTLETPWGEISVYGRKKFEKTFNLPQDTAAFPVKNEKR